LDISTASFFRVSSIFLLFFSDIASFPVPPFQDRHSISPVAFVFFDGDLDGVFDPLDWVGVFGLFERVRDQGRYGADVFFIKAIDVCRLLGNQVRPASIFCGPPGAILDGCYGCAPVGRVDEVVGFCSCIVFQVGGQKRASLHGKPDAFIQVELGAGKVVHKPRIAGDILPAEITEFRLDVRQPPEHIQGQLQFAQMIDLVQELTEEGLRDIQKVAAFIKPLALSADYLWHSGKKRAQQTAGILAEVITINIEHTAREGLAPNDDVKVIENEIMSLKQNIMIVGHLPFLSKLASLLLTGRDSSNIVAFKNAGIVCLNYTDDNQWQLDWIIIPDILD